MRNSDGGADRFSRRLFLGMVAALLLAGGCGMTDSSGGAPAGPTVLRIAVYTDGRVTVDDQPANIQELAARLSLLAGTGAQVYYYREAADEKPHPNGISVVQLLLDSQLPVSLSTRPDFADYVDAEGQSHPRPVKQ